MDNDGLGILLRTSATKVVDYAWEQLSYCCIISRKNPFPIVSQAASDARAERKQCVCTRVQSQAEVSFPLAEILHNGVRYILWAEFEAVGSVELWTAS